MCSRFFVAGCTSTVAAWSSSPTCTPQPFELEINLAPILGKVAGCQSCFPCPMFRPHMKSICPTGRMLHQGAGSLRAETFCCRWPSEHPKGHRRSQPQRVGLEGLYCSSRPSGRLATSGVHTAPVGGITWTRVDGRSLDNQLQSDPKVCLDEKLFVIALQTLSQPKTSKRCIPRTAKLRC